MSAVVVSRNTTVDTSVPFRKMDLPDSQIGGVAPPIISIYMQRQGVDPSTFVAYWRVPEDQLGPIAMSMKESKIPMFVICFPLLPLLCWSLSTIKKVQRSRVVILTTERIIDRCDYTGKIQNYELDQVINVAPMQLSTCCSSNPTYVRVQLQGTHQVRRVNRDRVTGAYSGQPTGYVRRVEHSAVQNGISIFASPEQLNQIRDVIQSRISAFKKSLYTPAEPTMIVVNTHTANDVVAPVPTAAPGSTRDENISKIMQLKDLVDAGALSPEEYERQKKELLARL